MRIINEFFKGIGTYGKAIDILFSRKFGWFFIFPFIFIVVVFWSGDWLTSQISDSVDSFISSIGSEGKVEYPIIGHLLSFGGILVGILVKILFFLIFLSFAGYIILIVMSPVFSLLASKVEEHLTGEKHPFDVSRFFSDIFRGIWIALRNMVLQFLALALLFVLSFIPLVGFFTPFVIFFVNSYFYGFAFVDYAVENKRYNVKQSVKYVNSHKGIITGVGALFVLALMIPYVRLFVCSFLSLLSVVAGTVAVYSITENE